jgi:probable rRNA maturation factor
MGANAMKTEIIIENLQDVIGVTDKQKNLLKRVVSSSLETENIKLGCEVSILLVDNERIREINKQYRQKDCPTDVLSFPMVDIIEGQMQSDVGDYDLDEELLILGDIVISLETAEKQAREYEHSFEREIAFLTAHGMLHLLGYDHESEEQEKKMFSRQEALLNRLGLRRD